MPLFKPDIDSVLRESGIIKPSNGSSSKFSTTLDNRGLTVDYAAEKLAELAESGEQNIKLKATELILKGHNAMPKEEDKSIPQITFVINGGNANLLNILTPRD